MAKLTTDERDKLSAKVFAGPDGSYPITDKPHAVNAKARATQQENAGNLSHGEANTIRSKANAFLKRGA